MRFHIRKLIILFLLFATPVCAQTAATNYIVNETIYAPVYTTTPDQGDEVLDSNFGAYLKRISDVSDHYDAANAYNLRSAAGTGYTTENCDGTMVLVSGGDSTSSIVYSIAGAVPVKVAELKNDSSAINYNNEIGDANEIRWNMKKTNDVCVAPKQVFYIGNYIRGNGRKFYTIADVTDQDNTRSLVRDFTNDFTGGSRVSTADFSGFTYFRTDAEGRESADSRYWAWMGRNSSNSRLFVFTYDREADTILGVLEASDFGESGNLSAINTVGVFPDGSGVYLSAPRYYSGSTAVQGWEDDTYMDGSWVFPLDFDITHLYDTGTVSVNNGSTTVTGIGTSWSGSISAGDYFRLEGEWDGDYTGEKWRTYEIESVDSNTQITLTEAWDYSNVSGESFAVTDGAITIMCPNAAHYGFGCDKSGNNVFVCKNSRNDIMDARTRYGEVTQIWNMGQNIGYPLPAWHFSTICDCDAVRGWAAWDIYDAYGQTRGWYSNNLMMWEIDDYNNSPTHWRVTHKYGWDTGGADINEGHHNLNADATRWYWGSRWNYQFDNTTSNHMEVIATALPSDWMCKAWQTEADCDAVSICDWVGGECTLVGAAPSAECGDGNIDTEIGETCDDSNTTDGDGCSSECLTEEAGKELFLYDWTKVGTKTTTGTHKVTITNLDHENDDNHYKDYGAGTFDDKVISLQVDIDACSDSGTGSATPTTGNTNEDHTSSSASSLTEPMTVGSGTNQALVCAVLMETNLATITSVTYNGDETMTEGTVIQHDSSPDDTAAMYYLLAPTQTTANVVAAFDQSTDAVLGCVVVNNVAQQAPEATATNESGGDATNLSITTVTDNAIIIAGWTIGLSTTTFTSNESILWQQGNEDVAYMRAAMTYKVLPTAGATTMSFTGSGSGGLAVAGLAFEPSGGSTPEDGGAGLFAMSDTLYGDLKELEDSGDGVSFSFACTDSTNTHTWKLITVEGGTTTDSCADTFPAITRYPKLTFNGTTWSADIYTDSAQTQLVSEDCALSVATTDTAYRYAYTAMSYNSGTSGVDFDGEVSDIEITAYSAPSGSPSGANSTLISGGGDSHGSYP